MQQILAPLRHLHRELYIYGPGIVAAVLTRYRTESGAAIALLCASAAALDLFARRWLGALLWIASAAVLFTALLADSHLWGTAAGAHLGEAAIAIAALAFLASIAALIRNSIQASVRRSRRERRALRRIPGTPAAARASRRI